MVQRIFDYIKKIEGLGGLVQAVESGWLHREIASYNNKYQEKIEDGQMKIVGVNFMRADKATAVAIQVFEYPETYSRQKAKLERLRKERDDRKVQESLKVLGEKCHTTENLYPYCLEAVKNLATLGEIEEVFREEFGLWAFPLL